MDGKAEGLCAHTRMQSMNVGNEHLVQGEIVTLTKSNALSKGKKMLRHR